MHRRRSDSSHESAPQYHGIRATAAEFFELTADDFKYELIDGVVIMSPSPTPAHQRVALEILFQLEMYLRSHPVGMVFHEVDVQLADDLVYRPEIVFVRKAALARISPRIAFPPDLVVEVISPESRLRDERTRFSDCERHGVSEYGLIDPERESIELHRLDAGRYVDVTPRAPLFASRAADGFTLELDAVRRSFHALG